ncbi:methionine aminopeptidase, type I [Beutenbergia cavernae DSM 12333]|uniref:Methionine aminopeptidase n=1 Tax=Beutenbergia cavernae (strain ATCC BAA-8 / DSM 12333 / CCUG 43141 / JCM 11478 / NBRC 16432 / NCIMB 13614 / HKI 0122) TaxID=471853 RepID=C5C0G9_BEUC1|nr:type I methionyl aminopeptidase [Beutenbergia cavernae]ACQ81365.1 methionine aminopeptidase, type I [Beutenbergia cavernae DSM 12333]
MFRSPRIELKTPEQIVAMRRSGLVLAGVLDEVRAHLGPGVTTRELDAVAAAAVARAGATSNFLGYHGYPATICTSVNDQVVHGIPSDRPLADGDVVSVDAGAIVDGWHSDSAFTTVIGAAAPRDAALVAATERAMWAGVAALASARRLGEVGAAVEASVTGAADDGDGFAIVTEYVGHGIGTAMHQSPDVPNYATRDRGPRVVPGLVVAIEPMLVAGDPATRVLDDDWTVVTLDGSRAAHVEHTVAVHDGGIWVLTAADGGTAGLAPYGVRPVPVG